jgi:Mrp family chromosome partitioning ATPase
VPTEIEARAPESISSPIVAEPAPSAEPAVAPVPRIVIPLPSTAPTATAPEIAAPAPAPVSPPEAQTVAAAPMGRAPEVRGHDTRRERAFATESHPGIASLLENIRLISNGRSSRMVVFCGASTAEAVSLVATALATHAERSGMRAFVAMLNRTAAGAAIVPTKGANHAALAVDLDAGSVQPVLTGWVERIAPESDLVVLTGPPLATSIDAALLACACDGLVIIAESEVTERAALQVAAERAKIAGCNTLGVVMHGTKNRLPRWLRRLVGDPSETHAPRED